MQGYFEYTLKGTRSELEDAKKRLEELARNSGDFATLIDFKDESGIKDEFYYKDKDICCTLTYGMLGGSGNINGIGLDYDEMMHDLSKEFKDLHIEGTGYLLDFPPYPEWVSAKGEDTYDTVFGATMAVWLERADYIDENGNLLKDEFVFECEACNSDISISANEILTRTSEYDPEMAFMYYEENIVCEECGANIELMLEFE